MTRTTVLCLICLGLTCLITTAPRAAADPLDRDAVLRLARERAVAVRVATAEVDRAAGALQTARAWRFNPELAVEAGPRRAPGGESWDRSVGLSQRLDLFGRGDRAAAAGASLEAARSDGAGTAIAVVAAAARLHLQALHAVAQRRLDAEDLVRRERLAEIANRRLEAGEVGRIDVHQATVSAARSRMHLAAATAAGQALRADLAALLDLDPDAPLTVAGDLHWPSTATADEVAAAAARHPALAVLDARRRAAAARVRATREATRPEIGLGASVGREEEADILRFGLSLGLPLFNRGGGLQAEARAAAHVTELRSDAARRVRVGRAMRAWQRHRDLADALRRVQDTAAEALDAGRRLTLESYRLGEISLDRVLLVEGEILEARHELNDLRLAVALAALDVAEIAALPPLAANEETGR